MIKLRANWAPNDLLSFKEVLARQGYYYNVISGDIYYHLETPAATLRNAGAIERAYHNRRTPTAVSPCIWLFITDNLELSEAEVRSMLQASYHVRMENQGRLVSSRRAP